MVLQQSFLVGVASVLCRYRKPSRLSDSLETMIITVGHIKGGAGKSTVAVNLAAEFTRQGRSVMLVDADPLIETTSTWIADRIEDPALRAIPHRAIHNSEENPSIHTSLLEYDAEYETVIVDVAGRDSGELRSSLIVSDLLLVPMPPTQPALDAVEKLLAIVEKASQDFNSDLKRLAVLNQVKTHIFSRSAKQALDYLADFDLPVAGVKLHERSAYERCMSLGRGVVEMDDAKAKAEIQLLAQEVMA